MTWKHLGSYLAVTPLTSTPTRTVITLSGVWGEHLSVCYICTPGEPQWEFYNHGSSERNKSEEEEVKVEEEDQNKEQSRVQCASVHGFVSESHFVKRWSGFNGSCCILTQKWDVQLQCSRLVCRHSEPNCAISVQTIAHPAFFSLHSHIRQHQVSPVFFFGINHCKLQNLPPPPTALYDPDPEAASY